MNDGLRLALDRQRVGHRGDDGFDVGRVAGLQAADEGVLPTSLSARNSSEALPPMAPDTAATMTYLTASRSKMRW